jgi:hypothetical protein
MYVTSLMKALESCVEEETLSLFKLEKRMRKH